MKVVNRVLLKNKQKTKEKTVLGRMMRQIFSKKVTFKLILEGAPPIWITHNGERTLVPATLG